MRIVANGGPAFLHRLPPLEVSCVCSSSTGGTLHFIFIHFFISYFFRVEFVGDGVAVSRTSTSCALRCWVLFLDRWFLCVEVVFDALPTRKRWLTCLRSESDSESESLLLKSARQGTRMIVGHTSYKGIAGYVFVCLDSCSFCSRSDCCRFFALLELRSCSKFWGRTFSGPCLSC